LVVVQVLMLLAAEIRVARAVVLRDHLTPVVDLARLAVQHCNQLLQDLRDLDHRAATAIAHQVVPILLVQVAVVVQVAEVVMAAFMVVPVVMVD
jgi:hypothetical protein